MIETVMKFIDAFERRSIADLMACFRQSDSLMTYGTAADEKRIGVDAVREQFLRDWAQSLSASMKMTWHSASVHDSAGWVAADFLGKFKTPEAEGERPLRATFVLERNEHSQWLIAHMHFSFPDASTKEGQSFPSVPDSAPEQQAVRRVLLENAEALVIETTYPIGGSVPMHVHRFPHVIYVIEGGTVQTTTPDGSVSTVEVRPGQTLWRAPQSHSTRNIGATTVRIVEVEIKHAAA